MLSRMTIRTRLFLVAAVPAVALGAMVFLTQSGAPSMISAGIAAGGAAAAAALATAVAGSITEPMRRLSQAAQKASNLPALVEALRKPGAGDQRLALTPVGLPAGDEIGEVARSFDAFQGAAARLAVSQATLLNKTVAEKGTVEVFVNLARRMQALVDHQIEFLDGLEAEEQDPDTLENLFQLDQLATRVRRNAESLLTLAGAAAARSWERPLAMSDVIRAGMAEVEDIGRVDLVIDDNAAMLGNVAADAAHLLSELLENATRWSPPDTRVEVTGRPAAGGYAILIEDRGIGMAADALAEANHILTGPPLAEATVARSLGLVVTGRLARRLGIVVRLAAGADGGIVAKVLIPPDLMVSSEGVEMEEVATGPRTLPFALARQEKRARISSQRSRVRRAPADSAPQGEATITPLPTSRWMDEAPEVPAEPVSRWADTPEVLEPAAPAQPAWAPAEPEWKPTASDWPSAWREPEPEPEPVTSTDDTGWFRLPVVTPAAVVEPVVTAEVMQPEAVVELEVEVDDEPVVVPEPAAVVEVEESPATVDPPATFNPEPPAPAASPAPLVAQWQPSTPVAPAAPAPAPAPAEPVRPPAAAWEPAAPIRPTSLLPTREAGEQRPMPPRRVEWPAATPAPAPPAPPAPAATEPVMPPAAAAPQPPAAVESPRPADGPVAEPVEAPRPTPMVRPARFSAAPSKTLAGDMPSRTPLPAADSKEDEYRRHLERATAAGLVRRVPKASLPQDTGGAAGRAPKAANGQPVAERLPDEVRSLLSSYRSGVQRGRADGPSDEQRTTTPEEQSSYE